MYLNQILRITFFMQIVTMEIVWMKKAPNLAKLTAIKCNPNSDYIRDTVCSLEQQISGDPKLYISAYAMQPVEPKIRVKTFQWYRTGFRPFYFDFWFDLCDSMAVTKQINIFYMYINELIKRNSNLNHTCPFEGAVIVPKLVPDISMFPPTIPSGKYRLTMLFVERKVNDTLIEVIIDALLYT